MAGNTDVYVVILNEDDVPGAKLPHKEVNKNSNHQLCRWLQCRGLPRYGVRKDLLERVSLCLITKSNFPIDVGVDGGKWHKLKLDNAIASSNRPTITVPNPHADVNGPKQWAPFVGSKCHPPKSFNYGNIYYHIVESVQSINMFITPCLNDTSTHDDDTSVDLDVDEENDDDCVDDTTLDVHTSKPMKKGQIFFKSGHVQTMESYIDSITSTYHVRAKVMASFKIKTFYNVNVQLSIISGHVKGAACNCKASSMGRCTHVTALLFAVLDYSTKFSDDSPTSSTCKWNVGRKREKDPCKVYDVSYGNKMAKEIKLKLATFDPRPPSMRKRKLDQNEVNDFVTSLQWSASKSSMSATMWEKILPLKYDDFTLENDEVLVLKENIASFLQNLKAEDKSIGMPFCLVLSQATTSWYVERSARITASMCHVAARASSPAAITSLLKRTLWCPDKFVSTSAMRYGNQSEPIARDTYSKIYAHVHRYVAETGLWINPQFPQLACSPDGLVIDQSAADQYGLLEIKCPYTLKGKPAKLFWKYLSKSQMRTFFLEVDNKKPQLKKSHAYYYQIQLQLAITERQWCDLMVYTCPEHWPLVIRVEQDPEFCLELVKKLVTFHHKYICTEKFLMRIPRQLLPYEMQNN